MMKEAKEYSAKFYRDGDYIVVVVDTMDAVGKKMIDVSITKKGICHVMPMFGLYYSQPWSEKSHYTYEELLEIVERNLEEYEALFEEDLAFSVYCLEEYWDDFDNGTLACPFCGATEEGGEE